MMASMLYYCKLTNILTSIGFEINLHDPCIANKVINGSHMKILFHLYDWKMSHCKRKANDHMIKWLRQSYESIFEDGSGKISVIQGKVHEYLGMTLDYNVSGQVSITMFSSIEEILTTLDKAYLKGKGTKSSAEPDNIFVINEDCKKLDQEKSVEFQNLVTKTLYATKRERLDTRMAITFLKTRVRVTDKEDWDKLVYLMRYIRVTYKFSLTLSANRSVMLKWWVDEFFEVNPNIRGHSGGGLSLGRGFPIFSSTKQNLNTKFPRRQKLWELMTSCQLSARNDI